MKATDESLKITTKRPKLGVWLDSQIIINMEEKIWVQPQLKM